MLPGIVQSCYRPPCIRNHSVRFGFPYVCLLIFPLHLLVPLQQDQKQAGRFFLCRYLQPLQFLTLSYLPPMTIKFSRLSIARQQK